MSPVTPAATANHLLDAVPRTVLARLQSGLERVELEYGHVIYEPEALITHVYFPLNCLVSLLTVVDDRKPLEVGMVGNEGMVGMALVLGVDESGVRATMRAESLPLPPSPIILRSSGLRNRALVAVGLIGLIIMAMGPYGVDFLTRRSAYRFQGARADGLIAS